MNGVLITGGVEIDDLVVRELLEPELAEQRLQLYRALGIKDKRRMPVEPAHPVIGRYGVRWGMAPLTPGDLVIFGLILASAVIALVVLFAIVMGG